MILSDNSRAYRESADVAEGFTYEIYCFIQLPYSKAHQLDVSSPYSLY